MRIKSLAAIAAACAMGAPALGQAVVLEGTLDACSVVNGTMSNTSVGFDGTCGEFFDASTWEFYTFSGVAGQVIEIEVDRATGELDPMFQLNQGDATGVLFSTWTRLDTASSDLSLTFLLSRDDEDPPALPGPFADPLLVGFVLPATDTYTLAVGGNCSNGGAASYDFTIDMTGSSPVVTNISAGTTHLTLQDAINVATTDDILEIGCGVLVESGISLGKRLTIRGAGKDLTTIDAAGAGRVMLVTDAADGAMISGLTIANGFLTGGGNGAGMALNPGANISIEEICFLNNEATNGGALFLRGGTAAEATGIHADRCEFIGNSAVQSGGGGIGGAVLVGPFDQEASATILNSLFKDNSAEGRTAAVECDSVGPAKHCTLGNCTFVENTDSGAGRVIFGGAAGTATINMFNCVIGPNPAAPIVTANDAGSIYSFNLIDPSISVSFNTDGGGNVTASPVFEDAPACDYRLSAGSPGLDMGDLGAYFASGGNIEDLNGDVRISDDPTTTNTGSLGSALDAGAYEFQAMVADVAPCDGDANGDGVVDVNDISFVIFRLGTICP